MENLLHALLRLLDLICATLITRLALTSGEVRDLGVALSGLSRAIEFYLEHESKTAD